MRYDNIGGNGKGIQSQQQFLFVYFHTIHIVEKYHADEHELSYNLYVHYCINCYCFSKFLCLISTFSALLECSYIRLEMLFYLSDQVEKFLNLTRF